MNLMYQTERLELRVLTDTAAPQILRFHLDNQEIFEEYETDRPLQFYTEKFQKKLIQCEYNMAVKQKSVRFWVFEKGKPERIIGTVSFHHINRGYYQSCELGYKFDHRYWGRGYARESISRGIRVMFEDMKLHRIEASVLPENTASGKLLRNLGFELEGVKRQSVRLHGVWRDHELYALLSEADASQRGGEA